MKFVVGMLGRYQSNLEQEHLVYAKKFIQYVLGTKDYRFSFKHSDQLKLIGYSDSDFGECKDTLKSTSTYIFLLSRRSITWKSVKRSITTSSTMKAEFVVC